MSLVDEITALRSDAALCRHGRRSLARAHGGDLLPWLERIASLSVNDMQPGELRALTLMDGKGKLRTDPRVMAPGAAADGLLLDLPASHHEASLRLLRMYVIADDVTIDDLGEEWELVTLAGPGAAARLTAAGLPVPEDGRVAGVGELLLAPSELSGTGGFDLMAPKAVLAQASQALLAVGAREASAEALNVVRVGAGVPWFDSELVDGVIPLEALLDRKVSTTKGCYPGQEVVARIVNLGQVARRLVRLEAPAGAAPVLASALDTEPGVELLADDGRKVGLLTSAVGDPTAERTLALGFAKRSHWKSGAQVQAGEVTLEVHSLAD